MSPCIQIYAGIFLIIGLWGTVAYGGASHPGRNYEFVLAEKSLTVEEAAESLRKKIDGQILEAKRIRQNGKEYYEFKVLTPGNGRVSFIRMDARSGKIQNP